MNAQQLKNSILQMAVSGKLVPQDPNDEPASVLLERIRKEKEQLIKEGKIKKEKNPSYIFRGADNTPYEKIGNAEPASIADEVPFDIPVSWELSRLGMVTQLIDGIKTDGVKYPIMDAKYLRGKGDVTTAESGKFAPKGSRLILVDGENSGEVFIAPNDGYMGSTFKQLWISQELNTDYVLLFIDLYRLPLKNSKKGAAIPHLNKELFFNLLLPIPPIEEQLRIVSVLNNVSPLLMRYDIAEKQSTKLQNDFPDQLKKSILQLAVQGKLVPQNPSDEPASVLLDKIRAEKERLINEGKIKRDKNESVIFRRDNSHYEKLGKNERCIDDILPYEIPENWTWCRLGNVGDWGSGATPSRSHPEYYGGNIPWLKTGDLNDSYIDYVPESITETALQETSVRLNPVGSILIAMYGATIGKLGIAGIPLTTNQACCACLPLNGIYNKYLFYYLMAKKQDFIKQGEGGAQPNISKDKIISTLMPVPPLEEQLRIVAKIEELLTIIKSL